MNLASQGKPMYSCFIENNTKPASQQELALSGYMAVEPAKSA
jgi:hypothetical protein